MVQHFELERKVLYNHGMYIDGPSFGIFTLWNYLDKYPGLKGPHYLAGELDFHGNFRGEYTISQDNILGYLEDCYSWIASAKIESQQKYDEMLIAIKKLS